MVTAPPVRLSRRRGTSMALLLSLTGVVTSWTLRKSVFVDCSGNCFVTLVMFVVSLLTNTVHRSTLGQGAISQKYAGNKEEKRAVTQLERTTNTIMMTTTWDIGTLSRLRLLVTNFTYLPIFTMNWVQFTDDLNPDHVNIYTPA